MPQPLFWEISLDHCFASLSASVLALILPLAFVLFGFLYRNVRYVDRWALTMLSTIATFIYTSTAPSMWALRDGAQPGLMPSHGLTALANWLLAMEFPAVLCLPFVVPIGILLFNEYRHHKRNGTMW